MSQPSQRWDRMQAAEAAPVTSAPPTAPWGNNMPQPKTNPVGQGQNPGQNVFGITSPMQAMSGGDPNKVKGIMDYYQGMAANSPPGSPQNSQAQSILQPNNQQVEHPLMDFLRRAMAPAPQQPQMQSPYGY